MHLPPPRGTLASEAQEAIRGYGMEVAPVTIAHRAAFFHSLTVGQTVLEYEPGGKAAQEINDLFAHACQHVGMQAFEYRRRTA